MRDRVNKPRVFLSHSAKDKEFIEKLAGDLRKCQIEPWLDTEAIRDGKPWLKVIFEEGIPACDAVIVYFTENSLQSKMVSKEIDAALVEELTDKGISFLPYVSSEIIRKGLRSDIRSLQCREWNEGNYLKFLPSVVAEIWRSYLEGAIRTAVTQEENRRLKLELELQKLREQQETSEFSVRENSSFEYIYQKLNRPMEIVLDYCESKPDKRIHLKRMKFSFQLINGILYFWKRGYDYFTSEGLGKELRLELGRQGYLNEEEDGHFYQVESLEDITVELKTYGLIKSIAVESNPFTYFRYEFTEKAYRWMFWLDFNQMSCDELPFEGLGSESLLE